MNRHQTSDSPRQDRYVRAAAAIGDFDNPFYAEERQRDVWNEASAFGLQLVLWLTLLATTIGVWVVGAPAVPYAFCSIGVVGIAAVATASYAARLGVKVRAPHRMRRLSMVPFVALMVAFFVGVFRSLLPAVLNGRGSGHLMFNLALGAAVGGGAALGLTLRALRAPQDRCS